MMIDLNYKDLKRANNKELESRATCTAVYKNDALLYIQYSLSHLCFMLC